MMGVEYYYLNDLNRLYNKAIENCEGEELEQLQSALDNIEAHIRSLEHWKDTALQISKNCGEANADSERLAAEYIKVLSEIGGVWWEDPFERSSALIAHKNRLERK